MKLHRFNSFDINEGYHDMMYDNRDMVEFGKFIINKPELRAMHRETLNTVDGVTFDMLKTTYDKMMKEHPEMQKDFDKYLTKNKKEAKFTKDMHLIIVTPDLKAYMVNNKGMITQRSKNPDFSGGWKLQAIVDTKYGKTVLDFNDITVESINKLKDEGFLFKNKSPKYTVRDLDHGTTRVWGNTIASLYFEDQKENVDEAETGGYAAPKFAIQPAAGDTGYSMVAKAYGATKGPKKKKKNQRTQEVKEDNKSFNDLNMLEEVKVAIKEPVILLAIRSESAEDFKKKMLQLKNNSETYSKDLIDALHRMDLPLNTENDLSLLYDKIQKISNKEGTSDKIVKYD